eukprot:3928765-Rhodomonas_salina.4
MSGTQEAHGATVGCPVLTKRMVLLTLSGTKSSYGTTPSYRVLTRRMVLSGHDGRDPAQGDAERLSPLRFPKITALASKNIRT